MLTNIGILELNNIAWPNKDMWLDLPPDGMDLLSPYKPETTPPNADSHSHSPFELINFPTYSRAETSTSYGAHESIQPLMPPPSLPSYLLQRRGSWENGDFTNDPFVDTKQENQDETLEIPSMDYDAKDEDNALLSLTRMRDGPSGGYFPQLFPLQNLWKSSTPGSTEQNGDQNRKPGSAASKRNELIRPSAMSLDQVLDNDHYARHSQQRAVGLSIPGLMGPDSMTTNGTGTQPLSMERILRSSGNDGPSKENYNPARPTTRRGIETRSRTQSMVRETEVLGELKINETPFESPENQNVSKGRARKAVTPGKAAGEKRKRPTMGSGRGRKNTSVNSTPSSNRKASKKLEVLGDMVMGESQS